jgi:hypothetical protein
MSPALVAWRDGASSDEVLDICIDIALTTPGREIKRWK